MKAIIYTKTTMAAVSFVACLGTIILMCVLIFWKRSWNTLVDRLKLYLTVVALALSLTYLLQVLPVDPQAGRDGTEIVARNDAWERTCIGIAFILQYVSWLMLLVISFLIVQMLYLAYELGKTRESTITSHYRNQMWLEIVGIVITLVFPLLFLWEPYVTDNYGLDGVWCGTIVTHRNCHNKHAKLFPGLGYLIGMWFGPVTIVALLCVFGLIFVTYRFWMYYKIHGRTLEMTRAIIKAIPPTAYLVIYNFINCFDAASYLYHNVKGSHAYNRDDYRLWVTHAVTGPCRALAIPIMFVLIHLCIHYYYKRRDISQDSLESVNKRLYEHLK